MFGGVDAGFEIFFFARKCDGLGLVRKERGKEEHNYNASS
jgi:hypothetical protein